jgi:hypothetical protein
MAGAGNLDRSGRGGDSVPQIDSKVAVVLPVRRAEKIKEKQLANTISDRPRSEKSGPDKSGSDKSRLDQFGLALMFTLFFLLFASVAILPAQTPPSFDLVVTHGHIIDGTGSPWYSGDVGIRNGKIAAIGNLSAAPRTRTIDAAGKVVAPGFIDMLGQSELTILVDLGCPRKSSRESHLKLPARVIRLLRSMTRSSNLTAAVTITTTSTLIGALFANILRAWKSKASASASTSPVM